MPGPCLSCLFPENFAFIRPFAPGRSFFFSFGHSVSLLLWRSQSPLPPPQSASGSLQGLFHVLSLRPSVSSLNFCFVFLTDWFPSCPSTSICFKQGDKETRTRLKEGKEERAECKQRGPKSKERGQGGRKGKETKQRQEEEEQRKVAMEKPEKKRREHESARTKEPGAKGHGDRGEKRAKKQRATGKVKPV